MSGSRSCGERPFAAALAALSVASLLLAEPSAARAQEPTVVTRFDLASLVRALPASHSVFSLLETIEPLAITDRISGPGLYLAEPPRFSMRGTSWAQNRILLDGGDITDPLPSGVPLLVPDVDALQTVEVTSALVFARSSTPGVTLALALREPDPSWHATLRAEGLTPALQQDAGTTPAIARFGSLADASAVAGGPLASDALGLLLSGRYARLRRFERGESAPLESQLTHGLARLTYRTGERQTLHWLDAAQAVDRPFAGRAVYEGSSLQEHTTTLGTNLDWSDTGGHGRAAVRVGFWTALSEPQLPGNAPPRAVERLQDGPVPALVLPPRSRRESDLVESVNVGLTGADYSIRYLPDPGGDILGPRDDQLLPVFDRRPESFGKGRYLLTNVPAHHTHHQDLELRAEKTLGGRLLLLAGATASRTEIEGVNAGFRVVENDQGLPGTLFDDANVDTYARGRSYFDRAFTIKLAAAWRAPGDLWLGVVTRYQDGQPFARVVVVPDLAQGPVAVPATPRGQTGWLGTTDPAGRPLMADGHRFTYTLTLDARVEKARRIGRVELALVVAVFNLLGMRNEVEEDVVWGPSFREPTAVQPPRALRLGARIHF